MTKIGILGSGTVGKTLAGGFLQKGYDEIMVGSGHPDKIAGWVVELSSALKTGTFKEAAAFGDITIVQGGRARGYDGTLAQQGGGTNKHQ